MVLVLVTLCPPGGVFGRWEFSLTRALETLAGRGKPKTGAPEPLPESPAAKPAPEKGA